MAGPLPACSNSPPSARDTFASANVTRLGKRVATVEAHAWQLDRAKPIAAAQMNILLRRS